MISFRPFSGLDNPTLSENYNKATRALNHYSRGIPEYQLDQGYDAAAQLLETGYSKISDPDKLGRQMVEITVNQYVEDDDIQPYWEGEEDTHHQLKAMYNANA